MSGSGLAPGWRRPALVVAAAAAWVAPIVARLWRTPNSWWIARDDGVITLSHARNLVDHGTIGVSPGGDRVEGFSSPLHFAVAVAVDVVTDLDATMMSIVVLVAGLAGAGLAFGYGLSARLSPDGTERALMVVALAFGAGLLTALPWTTSGWIGSGMENPLIVAAGASVAGGALAGLGSTLSRLLAAIGLAAFALARVEFAALVGPLVAALVVAGVATGRPVRRDAAWVAVPLAAIAAVHLARRAYFGAWLPNTAIVQDRGAGASQVFVVVAIALFAAGLLFRVRPSGSPAVRLLSSIAVGAGAVAALWLDATGRTGSALGAFLEVPGVIPIAVVAIVLIGARRLIGGMAAIDHHAVLWSIAVVPLAQLVVAGPARLDDHRVAGVAIPFLSISAVLAAGELIADRQRVQAAVPSAFGAHAIAVPAMVVVVLMAGAIATWQSDHVRALDYEVAWAAEVAAVVEEVGTERVSGALVITANPDLGKVSYEKRAVMVDLGWLGDPLLATLRAERPDLIEAYLGRVAVPDVVSTHSGWSCEYRAWLESPSFVDEYTLVGDTGAVWVRTDEVCPLDGLRGIWTRDGDAGEAEYVLTRDLMSTTSPVDVVRDAIDRCRAADGGVLRCQAVRRSVQRAAVELDRHGHLADVIDQFDRSPSAAFDLPMLERGPAWWEVAADEVARLLDDMP